METNLQPKIEFSPTFFGLLEAVLLDDIESFKKNINIKTLLMHDILGFSCIHLLINNPSKIHLEMLKTVLSYIKNNLNSKDNKGLSILDMKLSASYDIEYFLETIHHEKYLVINDYMPYAHLIWRLLPKTGKYKYIPHSGDNIKIMAENLAKENEEAKTALGLIKNICNSPKK